MADHKRYHAQNNMPLWRRKLHEVIFEADTPEGKFFDVSLLIMILLSVLVVMLDSVKELREHFGATFSVLEWVFTIFFTIEYIARILAVGKPMRYILSFYGIIDLLSILPSYLSIIFAGSGSLMVIRALRLLRVFRVLKLGQFMGEAQMLRQALVASRRKILVFIGAVMTMAVIMGTVMYMVESSESGFNSIPRSVYWAIVTLTTVGYVDISPVTVLGQIIASLLMIMGYGIIAVPTGIVSVELAKVDPDDISTTACPNCSREGHDNDAEHCKYCGSVL